MNWFWQRRRPVVVCVPKVFGPLMNFKELQDVLRGRPANDPLFRAVGQLLEYQRQICQNAVADKSNVVHGQTAFEAGAAASAADVQTMLAELAAGRGGDREMREFFGEDAETLKS